MIMSLGFVVSFVLAYVAWLFFNMNVGVQSLVLGVPVALVAAIVASKYMFPKFELSYLSPKRYVGLAVYSVDFFIAVIKANIFMIKIIMNPRPELKPALLRIPLRTNSEMVTAGVSNSITLTPGTLTVDASGDFLYVHWIIASELETEKAKGEIVGNFEKNLKDVFE